MTGLFDPFLAAAASQLAGLVLKTVWEMGNLPVDEAVKKLVNNAAKRYAQTYVERNGMLKLLGMPEPISLESIYTRVQLLDRYGLQCFESEEALEKRYREQVKRRLGGDLAWRNRREKPEKRSGLDLAN